MRFILKILALPLILITWILFGICQFIVIISGAILGIISGLVFIAAIVLFFRAGFLEGLSWLLIAFLISPMVCLWQQPG